MIIIYWNIYHYALLFIFLCAFLYLRFMLRSIFVCLLVFVGTSVHGQGGNKWLVNAQKLESQKQYAKASKMYWKAIESGSRDATTYSAAGQYFMSQHDYASAVKTYERAQVFVGKTGDFTLQLAQAYALSGDLGNSNRLLHQSRHKYGKSHPFYQQYSKLSRDINFQLQQKSQTVVHDTVINLGPVVNTAVDEYFPSIHGNDEKMIFTRKTKNQDEDFYWAHRDTLCAWTKVEDMGYPVNSSKHEGAHFMSMDRNYMFYMRCGNQRTNASTMGGCDLYLSYRKGNVWSEGEPFGATINTAYYEGMPCLSSDNKYLYFVSDKPGGFGGKDIWVTRFEDGLWQLPENLGANINTAFDELAPFLAIDNHTLYFTSNGHPGYGGLDIFRSQKLADGTWSIPQNMGTAFNTNYNEMSMVVHVAGDKAYFASDRLGGYGGYDIYETSIPETLQPMPMSILNGYVVDSFSDNTLSNAIIEFYDVETGALLQQLSSNRGDGSYVVALPIQEQMVRRVFRFGYQEVVDTILIEKQSVFAFETNHVKMLYEGYEEPEVEFDFVQVYFMKNQIDLTEEILTGILNRLKIFLHPDFKLQIYSYTDDSGTPFINEDFSYKRARKIADELVNIGFSESQLDVRGWGDANPILENNTEEHRNMNRRVEIRVEGKESLLQTLYPE